MKEIIGFTTNSINRIIEGDDSYLYTHCCSENQRKECQKLKRCLEYFPQGTMWQDMELGRLLKRKKFESRNDEHRRKLMVKFEKQIFPKCCKVTFLIKKEGQCPKKD